MFSSDEAPPPATLPARRRPPGAVSVSLEPERGSSFYFDAFSSHEPISTSLENTLEGDLDGSKPVPKM